MIGVPLSVCFLTFPAPTRRFFLPSPMVRLQSKTAIKVLLYSFLQLPIVRDSFEDLKCVS